MKKIFLLFLAATFIASCTSDKFTENEVFETQNEEALIAKKLKEAEVKGKNVTVEHATLEEINATMRQYGLKEFSKEEVEASKQRLQTRTTYACSTWNYLGDWDGDGTLNTLDLVKAEIFLCAVAGCTGNINLFTCTSDCPPLNGDNFSYLSYLGNGTEGYILNYIDCDYGRDWILAAIVCS